MTSTDPEEIHWSSYEQRVVGITTGTTTTIDFRKELVVHVPEMPVSLTVSGQSTFDFSHKIVSSVNNSSGVPDFSVEYLEKKVNQVIFKKVNHGVLVRWNVGYKYPKTNETYQRRNRNSRFYR